MSDPPATVDADKSGRGKDKDVSVRLDKKITSLCCLTLPFEIYDWRTRDMSDDCRERVQETRERETAVGRKTKVKMAASATFAMFQYCGLKLSHLVLPQYGRSTAGARTINSLNDQHGLSTVPHHAGVVCGGERKEHGGEKDHAMVTQHCFWSKYVLGQDCGRRVLLPMGISYIDIWSAIPCMRWCRNI